MPMTKIKKTLYISDLDGTLLNKEGKLSAYTREAIGNFAKNGVLFTCATGRTLSSVKMLLGDAKFSCPGVFSDGLLTFDMQTDTIIQASVLPQRLIEQIAEKLNEFNNDGFLYCINGSEYALFYTAKSHALSQHFIKSKAPFLKDNIFKIEHFSALPPEYLPLYFVAYDEYDRLTPLQKSVNTIHDIHCLLNRDLYHAQGDVYFMNILTDSTSKHSAIHHLKQHLGVDEVVAFGDNYNDLPMLASADRCYVPQNAIPEAKKLATQVIPSCDQDSVVKFIEAETQR